MLQGRELRVPRVVGALLIIASIGTIGVLVHQAHIIDDYLIVNDLSRLKRIIQSIHETAKIIDIEHQKNNQIDFLNVATFVGSHVGPLVLAHPEKWSGPYVTVNPTIQQKFYQIVRTNDGYFILPGDGVKLANGKIVGKDILLDDHADIPAMLTDKNFLYSRAGQLGAMLDVSSQRDMLPLLLND